MNIQTVVTNLRVTIAGKEELLADLLFPASVSYFRLFNTLFHILENTLEFVDVDFEVMN